MDEDLVREKEAAEILGCSLSTMRRRRGAGEPPQFFKIGGSVWYSKKVLALFLSGCLQGAPGYKSCIADLQREAAKLRVAIKSALAETFEEQRRYINERRPTLDDVSYVRFLDELDAENATLKAEADRLVQEGLNLSLGTRPALAKGGRQPH